MRDDTTTTTVEESAPKATMGEFSHSNPYTGKTFGQDSAFARGPAVAADGGEPESESGSESGQATETMADVDHEHPHDEADEANRVFARGQDDERTDTV